jgi:hypothetical protein
MPTAQSYTVSESATVPAPAVRAYAILADYRNGHPRILPPQFLGLTVEQGGVGDGTIIRFQTRVLGRTRTFRAAITEPEPGRVLVETDLDPHGGVTKFIVDPGADPTRSKVTITTEMKGRPGLPGSIERLIARRVMKNLYKRELEILTAVLQAQESRP